MTKIIQGLKRLGKVESCGLTDKAENLPCSDCVVFESCFFFSITDEKL